MKSNKIIISPSPSRVRLIVPFAQLFQVAGYPDVRNRATVCPDEIHWNVRDRFAFKVFEKTYGYQPQGHRYSRIS